MWVRSQNKRFLGNYDSFAVSESGIIVGYQGPEDGEGATLGAYETEEKALSVLDDMQRCINSGSQTFKNAVQAVYKMPVESEIITTEWISLKITKGTTLDSFITGTVLEGNILDFYCVDFDELGNDIYKVKVSKVIAEQWKSYEVSYLGNREIDSTKIIEGVKE